MTTRLMPRAAAPSLRARLLAAPLLAVALLLPAAPALAQQGGPPQQPPPKVVVSAAETRMMAPQLQVPGTVHSRQDAAVAAEVAGRVTWVAEAGTRLAEGEPIARLDDRALLLEVQQLDAQIKSLLSQAEFQTRELNRLQQLAEKGSAPLSRLEEAASRREVLAQDLVSARARRDRVALDIERAVVRAPFAGQIASRMLEVGEYSSPGAKVARLVAVDQVEVRAQAPVGLAGNLREGMAVALEGEMFGPSQAAEGTISRIIPVGEGQSRTFEVRVALPRPTADRPWIVGSAVRVALPSAAPEQVVAVHRDALVLRGSGTFLFRVNAENKAERLAIRTGTGSGEWVEVDGGLAPGDRVVTRGAERLRDGQQVDLDPKVS